MLFVDEAYYLHRPGNERDYGGEAIEILLQAMEDHRDDLVVVLAGYADRMATFFEANPGMQSRVAHHVDFPDFSADELVTIAEGMVAAQGLRFSSEAHTALHEYLELRREQPWFAGARSVRNALDRARMRQARRLGEGGDTQGRPRRPSRPSRPPTSAPAVSSPAATVRGSPPVREWSSRL